MSKTRGEQGVVQNIIANYQQTERFIVEQLYMENELHGPTTGSMRENVWRGLFEMIVPKKFVIEHSVFIIDSNGRISREVDLAIIDETYTPYIFRYGKLKFIPIEAVAAVVECKSKVLRKREEVQLKMWCEGIKSLKTAKQSIARLATGISTGPALTQQGTRPIRVLCALNPKISPEIQDMFDFVLTASKRPARINISENEANNSLFSWYKSLSSYNEPEALQALLDDDKQQGFRDASDILKGISIQSYKVHNQDGENISLLSFNFQFNQLLMLINNPMLFPHQEYVNMFCHYATGETAKADSPMKGD